MIGRVAVPSDSSISGCVNARPSATLARSASLRQTGSVVTGWPSARSAGIPVSCAAARLKSATSPVASIATTPLSIVATMLLMYSFASTTCA